MLQTSPTPPPKPSIHLNFEDWLPYLTEWQMEEDQKVELIQTLWTILKVFSDHGWELDPNEKSSGQSLDLTAALQAAVVNSVEQQKEKV